MNIGKTVKKIAALAAGATMLGATIMGATALDLSNYPAPFVTNGVWDGKIVVGARAATSDVVGAIDLAAALQADAKITTAVNVPGVAGTAMVVGDSAEFKAGTDILALHEPLNEVKTSFGANDLDALASGVLDTGLGSTPVKQYLKFDDNDAYVLYAQNDDDVLGDYLYFEDGTIIFEYHLEFTESATSEISGTSLPDFEGEVLNLIGAPYTIVDAIRSGSAITLRMMGGEVADVLRDGETKTYDIDGKAYEVTAVFIDSSSTPSAKLSVNGVMTKALQEGNTQVLGADVTVGVREILSNQREGLVEFYLGANKLELKDDDFTNTVYNEEATVKIGTKTLSDVDLIIKATNTTDELKINYIKFKGWVDDDYYVPAGKGLKEFLEYPEVLLTETWDIVYTGLMSTGTTDIKLSPVSEHSYKLEFTNVDGDKYTLPYLSKKDGDGYFVWGSDKYRLIFTEYVNGTDPQSNTTTFVSQKDYFVVSDKATGATVDDAITRVMRYAGIQTGNKVVNFEDLAGSTWGVSYVGTPGDDAEGDLVVDGKTHKFYVGGDSSDDAQKYALSIDLNSVDSIAAAEVNLVTRGGAVIDLGTQTFTSGTGVVATLANDATVTMVTTTPDKLFDEAPGTTVVINVDIEEGSAANKLTISDVGFVDVDGNALTLETDDANDNYQKGMTDYGAYMQLFTPDSGAPSFTVEFPLVQRGVQVFVTAGTVEVKEGTSTSSGAITTTTINPIAVGLAVLDTEAPAIGSKNMIVVGGPCINTVAAALMGNQEDCTAGFTPGKAVIKLFADKNALLVAGYSAQDTLGACRVLAKYDTYKLTGTEVEVIAADLSALSVNTVQ